MSTLVERVYWATGIRLPVADALELERSLSMTAGDFEAAMIRVLQDVNRIDYVGLAERLRAAAEGAVTTTVTTQPEPEGDLPA